MVTLQTQLNDMRKPMAELRANLTSTLAELTRALKDAFTTPKATAATRGRPRVAVAKEVPVSVFEVLPDIAREIPSTARKFDLATFEVDKPYLIRLAQETRDQLFDGGVKVSLYDFQELFCEKQAAGYRRSGGAEVAGWHQWRGYP